MFPRRMVMIVVIGLVIFSLISLGNNAGYSQGYQMGYVAAGGEIETMAPAMVRSNGFFWPFALAFGFIFKVGFFLLMLMLIGKFFHFFRWRVAGGHGGHDWHHHEWEAHKAKWAEWLNERRDKGSASEATGPHQRQTHDQEDIDRTSMI